MAREETLERARLNALSVYDLMRELFADRTDEERWRYEELLDEYVDKRIEEALRHYKLEYRDDDY